MAPRKLHVLISLSVLVFWFVIAAVAHATKKPPLKPININAANSEELQQVPGIGPATAEKILQMRKSYGTFKSVDDLLAIKGIGKKRLEKMRKYLTISKSSPVSKVSGLPKRTALQSKPLHQKVEPPTSESDVPEPPRP
jgi:competence ComEA-like helix-hairpin-helix protein